MYSEGFYAFVTSQKKVKPEYLKGSLLGTISFGLTITDENRRAVLYNEQLADVVIKNCAMKMRWQIKRIFKNQSKSNYFYR